VTLLYYIWGEWAWWGEWANIKQIRLKRSLQIKIFGDLLIPITTLTRWREQVDGLLIDRVGRLWRECQQTTFGLFGRCCLDVDNANGIYGIQISLCHEILDLFGGNDGTKYAIGG